MNKPKTLIDFVEDRPGHDLRYSLNSSKIRNEYNWSQKTSLEIGLKKTIDWYTSNIDWWNNLPANIWNSTPWKN